MPTPLPLRSGDVRELNGGLEDYLRALRGGLSARPLRPQGRCSTAPTAPPIGPRPAIFERLGAEVETIAAEPDGRNINDGCGSTHIEHSGRLGSPAPRRRSASPSTAMPTGCWRSTATGGPTTAMS